MARQIYSKDERREQALKAGFKHAKKVGVARVSVGMVAKDMGVTAPLVFHVFGSRAEFQDALAKAGKKAGLVFPPSTPTVRAARAAKVAPVKVAKKVVAKKVVAKKAVPVKVAKKAAPKFAPLPAPTVSPEA